MKTEKTMRTTVAILIALLTIQGGLSAEEQTAAKEHNAKHSYYKVIDLGTFGGPHSYFNFASRVINRRGAAVGGASTSISDPACLFDFPYCFVSHAFQYQNNVLTDLGPLPGGANTFAIAINSRGAVAGISENGLIDPITGTPAFVATIWKNGQITDLGTFGGSFSLPNDINSRGQAAGGAEDTTPDASDFGGNTLGLPSPTQWHATLWQHGTMQNLGALGDGPDSFALFVNKHGQVAGISYTDSIVNPETGIPTVDPFFWQNGRMVDVGTLGGVLGTVGGLNDEGQVAGTSDVTRDRTVSHAFLWERGQLQDLGTFGGNFSFGIWLDEAGGVVGGATTKDDQLLRAFRWKNGHMTNLGSLNGDQCSVAIAGNSKGQVVGNSLSDCDHETHAFLWENDGPMVDLNSFVPPGSGILLREGAFINERGEIAVIGRLASGDNHAFVLVPDDDSSQSRVDVAQGIAELDQSSLAVSHVPVTPEKVAAFAARSAHRNRGFGAKPTK